MKRSLIFWVGICVALTSIVFQIWWQGSINALFFLLLGNLAIWIASLVSRKNFLKQILLQSGKDGKSQINESAVIELVKQLSEFRNEITHAISGIKEIGQDKFDDILRSIGNEEIKTSLLDTHSKIVDLRKKDSENNWVTQGIASIAQIKGKNNDLDEYAYQIISSVVKYLKANQGGFFILHEENGEDYFELTASYAYEKRKFAVKRIYPGEGLIGQAYYEKDAIYLTEVPNDYVRITSGLGEALPRCICVVPLLSEGNIYGAIEIASFQKLQPHEMLYLRDVGESVGYNLHAIEGNSRTERLLNESQQMAQEVKSQEEELRQNMEELTTTQEQMRRKQTEIDAVLASLSVVELDLSGAILTANSVFTGITGYEDHDLIGKFYKNLIPEQGTDRKQFDMMWSSLLSGQVFSGEFKIRNQEGLDTWMVANFTPLLDSSGKPYKVTLVSLFNTKEKEKLLDMQEMMSAFKLSLPFAEINPDLTFKTANELFLAELGIKRMELKKLLIKDVLHNGSYLKLENYFNSKNMAADTMELGLRNKSGIVKQFSATILKVNTNDQMKKGLLILRNAI
jgi:PAS domain S-box-containing protein